jgi:hypothetical protein
MSGVVLFKVTGKVEDKFVGKGLDGLPRQSVCPTVLHPDECERLDKLAAGIDLHKGGDDTQG